MVYRKDTNASGFNVFSADELGLLKRINVPYNDVKRTMLFPVFKVFSKENDECKLQNVSSIG